MHIILVQPTRWHEDGLRNFAQIRAELGRSELGSTATSLIVLPELVGSELERHAYEESASDLALLFDAWVIAGSHHVRRGGSVFNSGVAVDPRGAVVANYEKANPYGVEVDSGVDPGSGSTSFEIDGRRVLVMLCADFWFADSFDGAGQMDMIVVPAFSITQRRSPDSARALWAHMAVARAYEHMAFVAVSDWAASSSYREHRGSGAAGLADPNPAEPHGSYYSAVGPQSVADFPITFDLLDDLRVNRSARGFVRGAD